SLLRRVGASQDDLFRKRAREVRCRPLVNWAARTILPLQPINQAKVNCRSKRSCGRLRSAPARAKNSCRKRGIHCTTMTDLVTILCRVIKHRIFRGLFHAPRAVTAESAQFE